MNQFNENKYSWYLDRKKVQLINCCFKVQVVNYQSSSALPCFILLDLYRFQHFHKTWQVTNSLSEWVLLPSWKWGSGVRNKMGASQPTQGQRLTPRLGPGGSLIAVPDINTKPNTNTKPVKLCHGLDWPHMKPAWFSCRNKATNVVVFFFPLLQHFKRQINEREILNLSAT